MWVGQQSDPLHSACQEKYVRELSVTSEEYFTQELNHSPVGLGCPTWTILHGENEAFQSNRYDFPKATFTLDGIWRHIWGNILQLEVNKMA
jgi:hypothetical protein